MTENEISKVILDSAIAVHKELGPGLLESVYEVILAYELGQRGLARESSGADTDTLQGHDFRRGIPG